MSKRPADYRSSASSSTTKQERKKIKRNVNLTGERPGNTEVPIIKGCPAHLVPLLLHAVKTRRKLLSLSKSVENPRSKQDFSSHGPVCRELPSAGTVKDTILSKLCSSKKTALDEHTSLQEEAQNATDSFLRALRREESGIRSHSDREVANKTEGSGTSASVASFTFLLDLLYDPNIKLSTRRSALLLAGELLKRSSNCRQSFTQTDCIRGFLTSMGNINNARGSSSASASISESILQDSLRLLVGLSAEFGEFYPRLTVAARYLQEKNLVRTLPSDIKDDGTHQSMGMTDLRRIRNVALKYGEKECIQVRKLLNRADVCFEVLVPRVHDSIDLSKNNKTEHNHYPDLESWSDDDIDWEEGDDVDDAVCSDGAEHTVMGTSLAVSAVSHEQAVDRTMAIFERSGGMMGDGLEINFDRDRKGEDIYDSTCHGGVSMSSRTAEDVARADLQKCVESLSSRHFTRLNHWVDSLVSADNMVEQQHSQNNILPASCGASPCLLPSSLVLMPAVLRQKKSRTLRALQDLKQEVSRCLAAASKLSVISGGYNKSDIQPCTSIEAKSSPSSKSRMITNTLSSSLGIKQDGNSVRSRLLSVEKGRGKGAVKKASRVQIKVRKS